MDDLKKAQENSTVCKTWPLCAYNEIPFLVYRIKMNKTTCCIHSGWKP